MFSGIIGLPLTAEKKGEEKQLSRTNCPALLLWQNARQQQTRTQKGGQCTQETRPNSKQGAQFESSSPEENPVRR